MTKPKSITTIEAKPGMSTGATTITTRIPTSIASGIAITDYNPGGGYQTLASAAVDGNCTSGDVWKAWVAVARKCDPTHDDVQEWPEHGDNGYRTIVTCRGSRAKDERPTICAAADCQNRIPGPFNPGQMKRYCSDKCREREKKRRQRTQ